MGILEMRSSLNEQNKEKNIPTLPHTTPDWVVCSIYEKRNGLTLTPLPAEVRKKFEERQSGINGDTEMRRRKAAQLLAEIAAEGDEELRLRAQASLLL